MKSGAKAASEVSPAYSRAMSPGRYDRAEAYTSPAKKGGARIKEWEEGRSAQTPPDASRVRVNAQRWEEEEEEEEEHLGVGRRQTSPS